MDRPLGSFALYVLLRMLAQLVGDGCRRGQSCQYHGKGSGFGKIDRPTLTFEKSTSTLPSIPLFEVDNGHIGTQGHLWPTLTQAVSALHLTRLWTALTRLN